MENRRSRLLPGLLAAAALLLATPVMALDFQVHGYDLGERISLQSGRSVWTAELDVSLETVADHVSSFCVDLDSYIGVSTYSGASVLDASTAPPGPSPSGDRNFAWAGHVMASYGHDIDPLVDADTTRDHVITGVQAAIWEGLYGAADDTVDRGSLSSGAQRIFDRVMTDFAGFGVSLAGAAPPSHGAHTQALIVDLPSNQDQVLIVSNPVPEPSAALVFGLGTIVAGGFVRKRR